MSINSSKTSEQIRTPSAYTALTSKENPMLTATDQQLLLTWNTTQQEYQGGATVSQLVAMQADLNSEVVALVAAEQNMSYGELNRRANQLAHYLQQFGVGPNVLVGICVERSLDMVIGLLGILKAGGAYVPLDSTYPSERLAFMLNDAQTRVVVAQQHLLPYLPIQNSQVVCLDRDASILAQQSETNPQITATPSDLAYVIYTSGSTGQPKGVKIAHESLLNLVFWHRHAFAVTEVDRATQLTSLAFDATGWELWPYLTAGASIYLVDEEARVSPLLLRDWLLRNEITITFLPTILAERVITLKWPEKTVLRFLLTGADTLQHYPAPDLPFAFVNNYGPTEATVVATSGIVLPTTYATRPPSIGRPIANTQIYLLDEQLQQIPIGEVGEMYIGGINLSRGYLNQPELTRERFIPHPFDATSEAQLYKTGDLARFLPDGQIEFMGRADFQIKIRGYRIEPNEIINALNTQPSVQASIVVAQEDAQGEKQLVAYIVAHPNEEITLNALYDGLATHLPDYMLPATFVLLDTLPMTPNGKVDRAALPQPDTTNIIREATIVAPTTPVEEQLVSIILPLLSLEQISTEDNFFLLGGHSLFGTQVIARVADTFGVELSLRTLFESPTIQLLSAEIERLILEKIEAMSEEEVRQQLG